MSEPTATAGSATAFDPTAFPRRVNLGCGWDRRPGYLNVDLHAFHEPDLVADVRDLPMLPTGGYDEVVAQDVLEHLPRGDALPALREWARLLGPGGQLVLRVPDLVALLGLFADPELRSREKQEELVQCLFGTQAYDGDVHLNGFSEVLLRHFLHDAGFDDARFTHRDEWLFDVVARRAAGPVDLDLGDLPFMVPGPGPLAAPEVAETAEAAEAAEPGPPGPPGPSEPEGPRAHLLAALGHVRAAARTAVERRRHRR